MALAADVKWVKARLPSFATFNKHGQTVTVDQAVREAIDAHAASVASKYHALADLYEALASDYPFDAENVGRGEKSYSKPQLLSLAEKWRADADALEGSSQWSEVPIESTPRLADEYSSS